MSEEEKKAIEEAKKQIEKVNNLNNINIFMTDSSTLKILLHLVDRLQKEIENLKECLKAEEKYSESLNRDIQSLLHIEPNDNFISKDKIRNLIYDIRPKSLDILEIRTKLIDLLKED